MSETIQWAKLEPKERNRLVAENVMGWDPNAPCKGTWVSLDPEPDGLYCTGCGAEIGWGTKNWDDYHDQPRAKAYTQSMDLAWQIVDLCSGIELSMSTKGRWHCKLWYKEQIALAHTSTPQEAICIASLRACGVEIAE